MIHSYVCQRCGEKFLATRPFELCQECEDKDKAEFYAEQDLDWHQEKVHLNRQRRG